MQAASTVSILSILAMCVTLVVTAVLPIGISIMMLVKKKWCAKPFLVGAAVFFVFQLVIRVPLLQLLSAMPWFQAFAQNTVPYALFLGGTAALFEVFGRYGVYALFLKNERAYEDGLAAGFAHGATESLFLVGMTMVNNIILSIMINIGLFGTVAATLPEETAQAALTALTGTHPALFLVGGMERVCTVLFHVAVSLLVILALRNKNFWYVLLAFALHMALDTASVLIQSYTGSIWLVELLVGVFAVASLLFIWKARPLFSNGAQEAQQETSQFS